MLFGNQMEMELLDKGLIDTPRKQKKKKHKKFKCHKCGNDMIFVDETNIMVCEKCNQFFIFDN